ncbi:MAG: short-chain fatty acyl-CoA regulator family protein [Pseudomonadota bacterium]
MPQGIVGARIRARRRAIGLTQAELARRIGISPSYLNLIERNKRGIAGKLLGTVARELDVRREELDGASERRLFDEVAEIAADPRFASLALAQGEVGDLVGRYPGWSRALSTLFRAERDVTALNRALSDRLTHDPFLGEAVHRMLTHTAALRAGAEILRDVPDLEPGDRQRFTEMVAEESAQLSDVGTALAGYFDRAHDAAQALTPGDEVEAMFERRANHFAEIEAEGEAAIEEVIDTAEDITSEEGRALAEARLKRYAADAAAAPLGPLSETAAAERYDVELIAERLGTGVDTAFRRLASLPHAPGRPRFGYLETNAAGVATEYRGIPGFVAPRHGAPCPIWVNYRAAAQPDQALRQIAAFPTGLSFLFVARARRQRQAGFGRTGLPVIDMLVLDAQAAGETVYDPAGQLTPEPVGQSCRICPRAGCDQRVLDSLAG